MENKFERGNIKLIPGTVPNSINVEVPVDSVEYQAFLRANKRRETARETNGGPDPQAEAEYFEAVQKVDALAIKLLTGDLRVR